jgi:hypothetical protein
MLDTGRLHLESEVDRFAADEPIVLREDLSEIRFQLESDNPDPHTAPLQLEGSVEGTYELRQDEEPSQRFNVADGWPSILEVAVAGRRSSGLVTIVRLGD